MKHIKKVFKGYSYFPEKEISGYELHIKKIVEVWNGNKYKDFGLERIFRLFLVLISILFPGVLIENIFKSKSYINRKLIIELYVFLKTIFPFFIIYYKWYSIDFVYYLNFYLLAETYTYLLSKIFLAENGAKDSTKRSLLLLIMNFLESALSFAVIYISGNYLNIELSGTVDAIYYSIATSATVGYGDIFPITKMGKIIATFQMIGSVSFIVLFFNFFSGKANQAEANELT